MEDKIYEELNKLFEIFEYEEILAEIEIKERCKELILDNKFNQEYMNALNDVLNNRGYSFKFIAPNIKNKKFIKEEFYHIIANATRTSKNTLNLIEYLNLINDYRLTLSALYALKIKHLISLNYLPHNNKYVNKFFNDNLQVLFFNAFNDNSEVYNLVLDIFEKIGIKYARLNYMEFRLDMEFLLLTILFQGKGKTYSKVNTLKVAFNIVPRDYIYQNDKKFYEEPENEKVNKYLKILKKDKIIAIKEKWNYLIDEIDQTGYKSLFLFL